MSCPTQLHRLLRQQRRAEDADALYLEIELPLQCITVNSVAPGAIETPINNALMNHSKMITALLGNIPAQHLVQPHDVGGAVSFLASGNTSCMTGTTLFFDGDLLWNYREQ